MHKHFNMNYIKKQKKPASEKAKKQPKMSKIQSIDWEIQHKKPANNS